MDGKNRDCFLQLKLNCNKSYTLTHGLTNVQFPIRSWKKLLFIKPGIFYILLFFEYEVHIVFGQAVIKRLPQARRCERTLQVLYGRERLSKSA